jgi:hypothetical protein
MSTLYITAVYLFYAGKIRKEFPYIELKSNRNNQLLDHLWQVRLALGGKYGLWESIQDAIGDYMREPDTHLPKTYKDLCKIVIDKSEYVWVNRLIDFYRDIGEKREAHLESIEFSLRKLMEFLIGDLEIKQFTYTVTERTLEKLKEKVDHNAQYEKNVESLKKDRQNVVIVVEKLRGVVGEKYDSEIDFTTMLLKKLGYDLADDFKHAILQFAEKR